MSAIFALGRYLPASLKAVAWAALDRLGAWPQRIAGGPAQGLTLFAPLRRRSTYAAGHHEPHVLSALAQTVQPGMVVCDVGSHLGYFALALAQLVGPRGHVYAFEPLPRHVAALRRSLAHNGLAQVTVIPEAVGTQAGTVTLEAWHNEAMTRVLSGAPSPWGVAQLQVPMTTLDGWASRLDLPRLDLIKLDIEGFELAALAGGTKTLARFRPRLLLEVHRGAEVPYRPSELVAWLDHHGYDLALIPPPDVATPAPLAKVLARLEVTSPPSGQMMVAHLWALPRS